MILPNPRVKRTQKPKKDLKRSTYDRCLPELLIDFDRRCAYSMQHIQRANGKLEIDHFDPREKKEHIQHYKNLFPASRHCNGFKSNTWPNAEEISNGLRFLNCCEEMDYGVHIFEDPSSFELLSITAAGFFHITQLDLNADFLIEERKERKKIWNYLRSRSVTINAPVGTHPTEISLLITQVSQMIPEIPPPPPGYTRPMPGIPRLVSPEC